MTDTMKRLARGMGATVLAVGLVGGYVAAQNTSPAPGSGRDGAAQRGPGGPRGQFGRGGPGGAGRGMLPPMMLGRLDLTDAQKDCVKGIVDSHAEETRALRQRAMQAQTALETAIASNTFDEATVRTRAAEVGAVEADLAVARARVYAEVYQLLTPEQQTKLKDAQANMQQRGQNGRGQRAPR